MSQAPAQLTIKRPPEPVSQIPEQFAVGRQAHEGVAPHPAGNAKQEWEPVLPGMPPVIVRQYVVAGSQAAHAAAPPVPPPPPAPPHAPA